MVLQQTVRTTKLWNQNQMRFRKGFSFGMNSLVQNLDGNICRNIQMLLTGAFFTVTTESLLANTFIRAFGIPTN